MDNIVKLRTEETILEEAGEWIAKLDRGLSDEEIQALKQWMQVEKRHEEVFLEMARLWDKMSVLESLSGIAPEAPISETAVRENTPWWPTMAAALLVGFIGLMFLNGGYKNEAMSETTLYQTGIGENKEIILADNSVLKLNTQSLVKVTYTDHQRILELNHGEIHIDVAHNKDRPLSVYAAGKVMQAVGTAFNVELYQQQLKLTVTDGKVLVAEQDSENVDHIKANDARLSASSLLLTKGETSDLNAPQQVIEYLQKEEIDAVLSWQAGKLIFRGETLEQAMQEVSRYTGVKFEFADAQLESVKIAGSFKTNDLAALLTALKNNFSITHVQREDGTVVLKAANYKV